MSKIIKVEAREILDSRGNPTIETEVTLENGAVGAAAVPSGASTGASEALELRDNDLTRYGGKGVLKAINNVNAILAKEVIGMNSEDQKALDQKMIHTDGTENKSKLGANAILSISLAACRATANEKNVPLYQHIAQIFNFSDLKFKTIPMFNIINGGKHSDSGLSVQEFKIIPNGIEKYSEQLRAGSEIFYVLKNILEREGFRVVVGDEGGFAPKLNSHEQALQFINTAITEAGYVVSEQVSVGLDAATDSFYDVDNEKYLLEPEGRTLSRGELIEMYEKWIDKYNIISIEDGLYEEDWEGWGELQKKLGDKVMLIGDDLLVTNPNRVRKAIEHKACNSVLIKVNQIGTLSETIECIQVAKENNMKTVISHRSGETTDDFIADLAIGTNADFIKTGSVTRGERVCKYNRLLKLQP
ncbi:MAG: phosphopyruvate hydratase [Candidatus Moranbacteria bacterium]|nr:phosphopyruvate hydratase [Candidatus Moranbacteria bacterium]